MDVIAGLAGVAKAYWPIALAAAAILLLEWRFPWRRRIRFDPLRWLHVLVCYFTGVFLGRLLLPLTLAGASLYASAHGIGLFHALEVPVWAGAILGVMALDLGNYLRHRLHHNLGLFWRMHRLHHADTEVDTATAFRFHPAEIVLSAATDVAVVLALGVPPVGVVLFAALVLVFDLWEHASIRTPRWTRHLLWVVVTPEMHRIHHSDDAAHHHGNYGTILSIWDRLFGTFVAPERVEAELSFGLGPQSTLDYQRLGDLLSDPLRPD